MIEKSKEVTMLYVVRAVLGKLKTRLRLNCAGRR